MTNPDAPDLATTFGRTALAILTDKIGASQAEAFAAAICEPTLPGTPARQRQDAAWAALTRRLAAAAGGEGDAP